MGIGEAGPQVFYDRMNLVSSIVITSCFLSNILDLANCIACYSRIWLHHGFELQVLSSKFRNVLQATSKLSSLANLYELIASCQHELTSSTEWFYYGLCANHQLELG
jgi:hypothetical protein